MAESIPSIISMKKKITDLRIRIPPLINLESAYCKLHLSGWAKYKCNWPKLTAWQGCHSLWIDLKDQPRACRENSSESQLQLRTSKSFLSLLNNTLICYSVDGLVLCLCHVAEVGEDHKAGEEAGEAVDGGRDLSGKNRMIKFPFRLPAHHDVSVAVVVELVVACIGEMNPKTSASAVEYLDGSIDPHLLQLILDWSFSNAIQKQYLGVTQPLPVYMEIVPGCQMEKFVQNM